MRGCVFHRQHPLVGAAKFTFEGDLRARRRRTRRQRAGSFSESGYEDRQRRYRTTHCWSNERGRRSMVSRQTSANREPKAGSLEPHCAAAAGALVSVARVYDGKEFMNFVNGVQESSRRFSRFTWCGHASSSCESNKVYYARSGPIALYSPARAVAFRIPKGSLTHRSLMVADGERTARRRKRS